MTEGKLEPPTPEQLAPQIQAQLMAHMRNDDSDEAHVVKGTQATIKIKNSRSALLLLGGLFKDPRKIKISTRHTLLATD